MTRIYTWVTRDGRLCWATRPQPMWLSRGAAAEDAQPGGKWVACLPSWSWSRDDTALLDRELLAIFGGGADDTPMPPVPEKKP